MNNSSGLRVDLKSALMRWLKFSMTQPGMAEEYVVEQLYVCSCFAVTKPSQLDNRAGVQYAEGQVQHFLRLRALHGIKPGAS